MRNAEIRMQLDVWGRGNLVGNKKLHHSALIRLHSAVYNQPECLLRRSKAKAGSSIS
jgi:hypothetical protein